MGIIEDTIYTVYRKAISEGDMDQAKLAVDLAKSLREKVEIDGFVDQASETKPLKPVSGKFFNPFPYRYYPEKGVVVLERSAISLTLNENRLFFLFSKFESSAKNIKVITKNDIIGHMWGQNNVSKNAVRISIKRLREKIEPDPGNPQIIINIYKKGYIFLGKRIKED